MEAAARYLGARPRTRWELERRLMKRLGLGVADINWQPARDRWEADCPRFDAEIEATWCSPEAFARIADYVARTLRR